MIRNIREINVADLDVVSGGLDCNSAIAVGLIDMLTSTVLSELGDQIASARYLGRAEGRLDGACHAPK